MMDFWSLIAPGYGFTTGRNFVRFWSERQRYGGVPIVGYPASRPFVWDGYDVQVFQKGIFQWRPEQGSDGQAWFMNVFDEFTRRGLDARLRQEKHVPLPGAYIDRGKSFDQIMAERLALLDAHPALARLVAAVGAMVVIGSAAVAPTDGAAVRVGADAAIDIGGRIFNLGVLRKNSAGQVGALVVASKRGVGSK